MKVMCINDKPIFGKPEAPWLIKFGETYEVLSEYKRQDELYYELDIQPGIAYAHELFAPLSDIEETVRENLQLETI